MQPPPPIHVLSVICNKKKRRRERNGGDLCRDAGLPDEHHIGHVVDGNDEHNDNGGQAHLENGFPHGCALKKFFGFHEKFPLDFMLAMRYYKINTCSVNTSITRGDLENNR